MNVSTIIVLALMELHSACTTQSTELQSFSITFVAKYGLLV